MHVKVGLLTVCERACGCNPHSDFETVYHCMAISGHPESILLQSSVNAVVTGSGDSDRRAVLSGSILDNVICLITQASGCVRVFCSSNVGLN